MKTYVKICHLLKQINNRMFFKSFFAKLSSFQHLAKERRQYESNWLVKERERERESTNDFYLHFYGSNTDNSLPRAIIV